MVEAVKPRGIDRPWSQDHGAEEGDTNIIVPRLAPKAVDATPSEADWQADD
jgi:competence protein ComEC